MDQPCPLQVPPVAQNNQNVLQAPTPSKTTVKNSKNNTFSPKTIVPLIRNVLINEYCYAVYSTLHKIPLAVHEFLDKTIVEGSASRKGKDFVQQTEGVDPEDLKFFIDTSYYEKTDAYNKLGYDKGHMAPAKNYSGDQKLLDSTYTFANCIPQNYYFNRGSWKNLESYCRNLIRNDVCETIEIVSGPVFYSGLPHKKLANTFENQQVVMLQNGLVVPPKCYKIAKANVGNKSYLAAFVLANEKTIDNKVSLKNTLVSIGDLEYMTGLRFNFGNYRPLEQLDPVGMGKTYGDLHLQFYTKLYKFGQQLSDMNSARRQGFGYRVSVNLNQVDLEVRVKKGETDFNNIINEVGWKKVSAPTRRKINTLLGLHRDAKQLEALTPQLQQKIVKVIKDNLEGAKSEDKDKAYRNYITKKLYGNNYGYHYPCEEELKQIFPPPPPPPPKQEQNNGKSEQTNMTPKKAKAYQVGTHSVDDEDFDNYDLANDDDIEKLIQEFKEIKIEEQH